jgi:hypothetical protein
METQLRAEHEEALVHLTAPAQDYYIRASVCGVEDEGEGEAVPLVKPLRDMAGHWVQAYTDGPKGIRPVGCCYFCKLNPQYPECRKDDLEKAFRIDEGRRKNASSCAEVGCSWYCIGERDERDE